MPPSVPQGEIGTNVPSSSVVVRSSSQAGTSPESPSGSDSSGQSFGVGIADAELAGGTPKKELVEVVGGAEDVALDDGVPNNDTDGRDPKSDVVNPVEGVDVVKFVEGVGWPKTDVFFCGGSGSGAARIETFGAMALGFAGNGVLSRKGVLGPKRRRISRSSKREWSGVLHDFTHRCRHCICLGGCCHGVN